MLNPILTAQIGWLSVGADGPGPEPEDWFEVLPIALDDAASGAGNNTCRMRYKSPPMVGPCGPLLRLRLKGSGGSQDTVVNQLWVGKVAAGASGMPSGSAVQATFNGGSFAVVVPFAGSVFTDPISLSVDPETEDLVVSAFLTNVAQEVSRISPAPEGVSGNIVAGNVASDPTSYAAGTATAYLVDLIESNVDCEGGGGPDPVDDPDDPTFDWTAVRTFNGTGASVSSGFHNRTLRTLIGSLSPSPTGKWVRFNMRVGSSGNIQVGRMFASTVPGSQTNWEQGATLVPITLNGERSFTITADTWSDPVYLPDLGDSGHERIVVSTYFSGPTVHRWTNPAVANYTAHYVTGYAVDRPGTFSGTTFSNTPFVWSVETSPGAADLKPIPRRISSARRHVVMEAP